MRRFPTSAVLLASLLSTAHGSSVLDGITLCRANDPNLNDCVTKAANSLIPAMTKGYPEYGVPVLDPWFVPSLEVKADTQYVKIDLQYKDITHIGLAKMIVTETHMDMAGGSWKIKMIQPTMNMFGKYKSKGEILKVITEGEGDFNTTYFNTIADCTLMVSRESRDGKEYFKLDKLIVDYTFGTADMFFANMFGDDVEMGKTTNGFLTEHSHTILTELKPALEATYGPLFEVYIRAFLHNVPVNELFVEG